MGYFRRRLRRGACETIRKATGLRMPEGWVPASDRPPSSKNARYLRLVVGRMDPDSHRDQGIFQAAGDMADDRELAENVRESLDAAREWFNRHLKVPKGLAPRAIFWFKTGDNECIRHVWELVHLLQTHHAPVHMLTTSHPGRIVYEDDWQVAAIVFQDTPVRRALAATSRRKSGETQCRNP